MLRWVVVSAALAASAARADGLRFEVTVADGLLPKPTAGRLLVAIGRGNNPRGGLGDPDPGCPVQLGADVTFGPGTVGAIDMTSEAFPLDGLTTLKPGEYAVQAAFAFNADLRMPNAPGDLYGPAVRATLDPAKGGTVKLTLTKANPPDEPPADTARVKYLKFPSKLLSDFHKRPMFYRAAVVLPDGFDAAPARKYPLVVMVGGYGQRYTSAGRAVGRTAAFPAVVLVPDGAGPYGDPYQVNSANNGPYGDALTTELIPHVEATYRGVGSPHARFTTGTSTGGWVSFALQVFYPDVFNGCWSFAPDSVDFRAYERIDIYKDESAYLEAGKERPAKRDVSDTVIYSVRHECQSENVLGRGNRWWVSGKDWCAWNAAYGPRGDDGLPKPLWHPKTGAIDRAVAMQWEAKDLRLVLERNWATLAPKLAGKVHVYVGDVDDYYLNGAVRRLDAASKTWTPPFDGRIVFGPKAGHGFHPVNEWKAMAERYEATRPK